MPRIDPAGHASLCTGFAKPAPAHLRSDGLASDHPSYDLVPFDRFEKRLEITFAESFVAFALDDFEEYRPNHGLREDLQEQIAGPTVDQDLVVLQPRPVFMMTRNPALDRLVVRVGRPHEAHAAG